MTEAGLVPTPLVKKIQSDLVDLYDNRPDHESPISSASARNGKTSVPKRENTSGPRPYIEAESQAFAAADPVIEYMNNENLSQRLEMIKRQMTEAAKNTDFIEAARLRDEYLSLEKLLASRNNGKE